MWDPSSLVDSFSWVFGEREKPLPLPASGRGHDICQKTYWSFPTTTAFSMGHVAMIEPPTLKAVSLCVHRKLLDGLGLLTQTPSSSHADFPSILK